MGEESISLQLLLSLKFISFILSSFLVSFRSIHPLFMSFDLIVDLSLQNKLFLCSSLLLYKQLLFLFLLLLQYKQYLWLFLLLLQHKQYLWLFLLLLRLLLFPFFSIPMPLLTSKTFSLLPLRFLRLSKSRILLMLVGLLSMLSSLSAQLG